MYDFLLVINSNLGPISHRYWGHSELWEGWEKFAILANKSLYLSNGAR